jgi:acylphosphatase
MKAEARKILFSGRVQGVGFRMTAMQFAAGRPVSGTVRNLPDGRVEMLVEGKAAEIDALVERLREHFGGFVRSIEQAASPGGRTQETGLRIIE